MKVRPYEPLLLGSCLVIPSGDSRIQVTDSPLYPAQGDDGSLLISGYRIKQPRLLNQLIFGSGNKPPSFKPFKIDPDDARMVWSCVPITPVLHSGLP